MYEQISANKRKTVLLIFLFVLLLSSVGLAVNYFLQGGVVGFVIVAIIVAVSSFVSYFNSDKVALRMAHAVPADPVQYARYHNLVEGLCIASGLPKPRLYIVDDPAPNAFSTGRNPKHAAVAVTTGLLEKMNRVELEGVLAHELSHIRNYDVLVMTLAVTMVGIIALLSDFFLRIMFWTGGRGGRDDNNGNNPLGIRVRDPRVRAVDLRPDHRHAHAVRGEPQSGVPRRRVGCAAHAVPARTHLRAREAEGRPHVDALRVEGHRAPVDRGAARQGDRTRATRSGTTCSTRIRRSTTGSTPSSRCDAKTKSDAFRARRMRCVALAVRRGRARSAACGGGSKHAADEAGRGEGRADQAEGARRSRRSPGCPIPRARRRSAARSR